MFRNRTRLLADAIAVEISGCFAPIDLSVAVAIYY